VDVVEILQISSQREAYIEDACATLHVTHSEADLLLRFYRYKVKALVEAWFADPGTVRDTVGVVGPTDEPADTLADKNLSAEREDVTVQCEAWCSVVPLNEAHALACGHYLCHDCWTGFLESSLSEGLTALLARCPAMAGEGVKCRQLVDMDTWERYLEEPDFERYTGWVNNDFIDAVKDFKWCPRPACQFVIRYSDGAERVVTCKCGHRFCFKCLASPHSPAPCDLVKKWLDDTGDNASDMASQKLIEATAKPCPSCQCYITKDRHCNHMKCTKCSHHFCWLCLQPFNRETGHNDFYKCSAYSSANAKGEVTKEEDKQVKTNKFLQKLILHRGRFEDCRLDRIKALKIHHKLKVGRKQGKVMGSTHWLTQVVDNLAECFRVLQWTHAVTYYMQQSNQKELFDERQQALDLVADRLLEQLSIYPIADLLMGELMASTKKTSETLDRHNADMVDYARNELEAILLYAPDEASSQWACVSCSCANADRYVAGSRGRVFKCSRCNACREHGEPDCRAPHCGLHPISTLHDGLAMQLFR
jgi:ariadne-1